LERWRWGKWRVCTRRRAGDVEEAGAYALHQYFRKSERRQGYSRGSLKDCDRDVLTFVVSLDDDAAAGETCFEATSTISLLGFETSSTDKGNRTDLKDGSEGWCNCSCCFCNTFKLGRDRRRLHWGLSPSTRVRLDVEGGSAGRSGGGRELERVRRGSGRID
jgi:hypothetical protein